MSHPVNERIMDALRDEREEFLAKYFQSADDVRSDERGEYILVSEKGDPEPDDFRQVYLPSTRPTEF